MSTWTR